MQFWKDNRADAEFDMSIPEVVVWFRAWQGANPDKAEGWPLDRQLRDFLTAKDGLSAVWEDEDAYRDLLEQASQPRSAEYVISIRPTPAARETPMCGNPNLPNRRDRGKMLAHARIESTAATAPFYVSVYDLDQAYPVAVFRNGEELEGAALELALCTPFRGAINIPDHVIPADSRTCPGSIWTPYSGGPSKGLCLCGQDREHHIWEHDGRGAFRRIERALIDEDGCPRCGDRDQNGAACTSCGYVSGSSTGEGDEPPDGISCPCHAAAKA